MKKFLVFTLALVLTVGSVIGGTVAYLTSTDSDVNVMTLGSVEIDQIEQERDENGEMVDFTQNKPLFPAVGDPSNIDEMKNVVDKFVSVKNTGKSEAYVRTIFAVEVGANGVNDALVHLVTNSDGITWTEIAGTYEIAGNPAFEDGTYKFLVATYEAKLAPEAVTGYSLKQVYLDSSADNENVEAFGETFVIRALSQAVQTAGFASAEEALNAAFGEVTGALATEWLGAIPASRVTNAAELTEALKNAKYGETITLADGSYGAVTIDGELKGVTITAEADAEDLDVRFKIASTADVENVIIKGMDIANSALSGSYVDKGVVVIAKGATVKNLVLDKLNVTNPSGNCLVGVSEPTAEVTIQNSDITGGKYVVYSSGTPIANLNLVGNSIKNVSSWVVQFNGTDTFGAKNVISKNIMDNCTGGIAKILSSVTPAATFEFVDNTMTGCTGHDGKTTEWFWMSASTERTISGNTLDGAAFNPDASYGFTH